MDLYNLSTVVVNTHPQIVTYHLVSLDEVIFIGLSFLTLLFGMWYLQKHPEKRFVINKSGREIDLYLVVRVGFYLFVVAVVLAALVQYVLFHNSFVTMCDALTGVCS